ncbi:uncharacterized protein ARMOST_14604 [Armillaria ostoyae]|uniref:Protein kinase domain-containing protein n=1 Tax=Armillaria ostoyae TaxID=47428 RepID=A0A284RR19_ARMOS|nr:uncharacterized protein ARMOST_14604 [Armillaria ostoyae]
MINKLDVRHNDMRPGNIIVTPSGDPVVFDFAMADCEIDPDKHDEEIFKWIGDELAKPSSWARY